MNQMFLLQDKVYPPSCIQFSFVNIILISFKRKNKKKHHFTSFLLPTQNYYSILLTLSIEFFKTVYKNFVFLRKINSSSNFFNVIKYVYHITFYSFSKNTMKTQTIQKQHFKLPKETEQISKTPQPFKSEPIISESGNNSPRSNPSSPSLRSPRMSPRESFKERALKNLGFVEDDLEYPDEKKISLFTRNPNLRSYVRNELSKDVDERLKMVELEIQRLKFEEEGREEEEISETSSIEYKMDSEEEMMRRIMDKHKKEIEKKIFQSLSDKYRKEEDQRRKEQERQHAEELEKKKIEKRILEIQNEQKRQDFLQKREKEREEKNKLYFKLQKEKNEKFLEKMEEERYKKFEKANRAEAERQAKLNNHYEMEREKDKERRKKLKSKLELLQERERSVKEARQEKSAQLKNKRIQKEEIHDQLKQANELDRQKKIETLRKKVAEKDAYLRERLQQLDEEKRQILEEKRVKNDEIIEKAKQIREEKYKEKMKSLQGYQAKQQKVDENRRKMEEEREKDKILARKIEREIQDKIQRLKEKQELEIQKKHDEIYKRDKIEKQKLAQKKLEEAADREFEILRNKIEMSRRQFALLTQARRKETLNREKQIEIAKKIKKLQAKEIRRHQKLLAYLQSKRVMESKCRYMERQANDELVHAKTLEQLRKIAEAYGIDYDAIDQKAQSPRSQKQSVSEFITELGGRSATSTPTSSRPSSQFLVINASSNKNADSDRSEASSEN